MTDSRATTDGAAAVDRYPTPDMSEVELLGVLRAVADPTRLDIVRALADGEEHPKGTVAALADCTKATVAYHFRTLREAGVTRTIVTGRTHTLQLRRAELDERFPGLLDALIRG